MILTRETNMHRQTPVDQNPSTESASATATPTPPKQPGTSFYCQSSNYMELDNSEGICTAAGAKFQIFTCCVDTAASGLEEAYKQGCSDNGGTANSLGSGSCDLAD
ncbi:hypothetical protein UCDDA912_g10676 [Diaporthe ampelina]|uniref:Uncharacterized protein n=1 Tax=Diaporthe ampelina TaxID=1214573 RepID=A0A0G2H272_9PEZI|nr:hypothetical protein UCDDA912_g10676 [Diaporthe ampelina]